jgi:coenzyme PQQ synthesis protein D (PqqD)
MKYRLRETAVPWRDIDGEVIALDMGSETYLRANPAGSLLWKMLTMGATQKELVARLVSEFEIEPKRALADVRAFVGELQAAGLLED